ncbi:Hsp70 family protein [Actinomyces sp. S4-C9]|uniref:Hsp70 family protein n=1 Tax=Actinomyces sp. S4-C9 TaxID=1219581 RepID=UPI00050ED3EA|nr:Hsp70 family protein [Actinomyces sp. S4-C9]KGF01800.1 molecular chaperone DnaK [Actinomyces sp. S4-C9]
MSETVYGIDLGTTYSAIARISDLGAPEIIPNFEGDQTTPSVVYFEGPSDVIVGAEAKRVSVSDPDNACTLIKRHIGTEFPQEFQGEVYSPEAISGLILKELVSAANQETGGEVQKVVITVPAYFGVQEREATKQAGEIAGLEVIGIVTEPVAAALSIGMQSDRAETIMVYDLGGGTFDTTVMKVDAGKVQVVAVDGNRKLGGADWDEALVELCIKKFVEETGYDDDPHFDDDFMIDLRLAVEDAKKTLTKRQETTVRLVLEGTKANVKITREEFEAETSHLINQTIEISERTMEIARKNDPDISVDRVLLVGGSARMPMVREALKNRLSWDAEDTEFDLAVAKGAAIYGKAAVDEVLMVDGEDDDQVQGTEAKAEPKYFLGGASTLQVSNVLSRGVGVKFSRSVEDEVGYIHFFAHANDEIPMTPDPIEAGTLVDNQSSVVVSMYEQGGERESELPDDNRLMKDAELPLPEGLPKGSPIDITTRISGEGLVTMVASDPNTGNQVELEAMITVLDAEQVEAETAKVSALSLRS